MSLNLLSTSFGCTALMISFAGVVLMTELGQMLNLPRAWVFGYFRRRRMLTALSLALTAVIILIQFLYGVFAPWLFWSFLAINLGSLFVANYFAPYLWLRSQQHGAAFISVAHADELLSDDEDMLVLEINGDARAYARDWMQVPHFAGDVVGGENVVMSYCALSDLPKAFSTTSDGNSANFRVIAQVHNNLIFTDTVSGELYQQITCEGGFSGTRPKQFPVQRMPWHSFRTLYPTGKVFHTSPNAFDKLTLKLFDRALKKHYEGEPLFPTLSLKDTRLPFEEPVWGITIQGETLAITRAAFEHKRIQRLSLGGRELLAVWYAEFEMPGVYFIEMDGLDFHATPPDPYGRVGEHQLQRVPTYPGVRWMVWSHWFPETRLIS